MAAILKKTWLFLAFFHQNLTFFRAGRTGFSFPFQKFRWLPLLAASVSLLSSFEKSLFFLGKTLPISLKIAGFSRFIFWFSPFV